MKTSDLVEFRLDPLDKSTLLDCASVSVIFRLEGQGHMRSAWVCMSTACIFTQYRVLTNATCDNTMRLKKRPTFDML